MVAADDDAAGEAGEREAVAGFVLQVGERGVVAGVAKVESDLVDAGPEGVPLGPFGHVDVREARGVQERGPVDAGSGGQATVAGMVGLPVGQDEPGARAEKLARVGGGGVRIRGEVECVDGDGGVGAVAWWGSPVWVRSPVTNRARPARPNSATRWVACSTATGEKSTPTRETFAVRASQRPGPPRPQPRSTRVCPGTSFKAVGHVAEQAEGDEGEGLDLGRDSGMASCQTFREARGGRARLRR